jgi:hypothetical protein
MNFPIDKYNFIQHTTKSGAEQIIAISTYAGRTVKGIATCSPADTFSVEAGKELAAARCNLKVAKKRAKRAQEKVESAAKELNVAERHYNKMIDYAADARLDLTNAQNRLNEITNKY